MGIISVEYSSNLYWLGRYAERSYTTLNTFFDYYDVMLDKDKNCYKEFLSKLDIEDKYGDSDKFIRGYLYDDDSDEKDDYSVDSAFRRAYDNALVIRDMIGSESLAYIQLAINAFHYSRDASNLRLALMPAIDYLLAFWGSIDNKLAIGDAGTIIRCGKLIERLDLYFRFSYDHELINIEYENLCHVLSRIPKGTPYHYNTKQLSVLVEVVGMNENYNERLDDVLDCLGRLFEDS